MIAPILLDTDDSTTPDCVALETIERLAAEQSAALLHATATGGDDTPKHFVSVTITCRHCNGDGKSRYGVGDCGWCNGSGKMDVMRLTIEAAGQAGEVKP